MPNLTAQTYDDGWRSFALPFGGGSWQNARGSILKSDANSYGVVFGADRVSHSNQNLIVGYHAAVSHQTVKVRAPNDATGKTTAVALGLQGYYASNPMAGNYLFGHSRLGFEDGKMDRQINVNTYRTVHHASWKALTGNVMAGTGYLWQLSEQSNIGPFAALDYNLISRSSFTESGDNASRLRLNAKRFNSLRSSMGINGDYRYSLTDGAAVSANLQLSWDRELVSNNLMQHVRFANNPTSGFYSKNRLASRNSLAIQTAVAYEINPDLSVGAKLSSDTFRSGYSSVAGNLAMSWRF